MGLEDMLSHGADKLKELAEMIPGYKGYAERSERRAADSAHREYMAKRLTALKATLQSIQGDCLSEGNLEAMEPCEQVANKMDRLIERIRHASRGYSGLFDRQMVNEAELASVYEHDMALVVIVNSIEEGLKGLEGSLGDNLKPALRGIRASLDELDHKMDERENILRGVG